MTPETKSMIAELDAETPATRRVLERVPADKLTWKPHPKSLTLGQLARHVASLPGAISHVASQDEFDAAAGGDRHPQPENVSVLLPTLEAGLKDARAFLGGLDEASAAATWRMKAGERELMRMPRLVFVRSVMLNHWYHHRGQLLVYLRLLNVPVPAVYGDSADEKPFADQPAGAVRA